MSVRLGILALLAEEDMYGAQLRAEFEARTGGTWPLNIGQVYTTLTRLERDGLVGQSGGPDDEGRIRYSLTDSGRAEVDGWWLTPVDRSNTPRDELVIKLALSVTAVGVDVTRVVQTQRTATLRHLRDLTKLKRSAATETETDLAWLLVLDNLVFTSEAEIRWLDHVESTLARYSSLPRRATAVSADADTSTATQVQR
ncbi:PadR family transcriptional regulator [Janibacter sp. Soil728]|uniref:PadR family transcriptional regulator n=1 Tax=Janibacter sp. Soil728 TaxID=1736393 RepID=UPI0006F4CFF2|nr:PadR family transcriptional regulator [Janibacter sp. Soil728]KRE39316.1 PadR family transcriptional regulator [Janibacter sp. Soil728]